MTKEENEIMQRLLERYLDELDQESIPGVTTDFRLEVAREGKVLLNNIKVINALSMSRMR